jgi:hypothetical protein
MLTEKQFKERSFCFFPNICGFKGAKSKRCSYKGMCEYKTKNGRIKRILQKKENSKN